MSEQATLRLLHIDQDICRIGFGCEALGGFNWGDVDVSAIEDAIAHALDKARNRGQSVLFDTSDTYGPHLSEERLGHAVSSAGDTAVIATKFGVRLQDGKAWYDTSPSWADAALDASLRRLNKEQIDLYQLHWPDQSTPLTETLAALERFRTEGRIKAYGVCNVPPDTLLQLQGDFPGLASFSQSYSLLDRSAQGSIQALCDRGLVFLAYGCLAQGLLSGKYDHASKFGPDDRRSNARYVNFHGDRLTRNLKIVKALKAHAAHLDRPAATLALQFVLADLRGVIALAGIKSRSQWQRNLSALDTTLPDDVHLALQECADETSL